MMGYAYRCALVLVLFNLPHAAHAQSFQGLGFHTARGMSPDGTTVVGQSAVFGEATVWTQATGPRNIGVLHPEHFRSLAHAASNTGVVVGFSDDRPRPFRWTNTTGMLPLGDFQLNSDASGVNHDGSVIVGFFRDDFGDYSYRWTSSTGPVALEDLPGGATWSRALDVSADGNVIVGQEGFEQAYRWTEQTGMVGLGDLAGGVFFSRAEAVSADGNTVVGESTGELGDEAFIWTAATGMVGLGHLPGGAFDSVAHDVSANGNIIVGESTVELGVPNDVDPFIWDQLHGMRNLEDLLVDRFGLGRALRRWDLDAAVAISGNGRVIVGNGINPSGQPEAWRVVLPAYAVPEPSSSLLGGLALLMLVGRRRRRRGFGCDHR